jgi:hypothetical protein
MKNTIVTLLIAVLLLLMTSMPAFAGGDKVRGENAEGAANQVQVQDPPPFQP